MIKVIAFDLVGVLIREKDLDLSIEEDKIERLFGPNISDADFLLKATNIIKNSDLIMKTAENIIDRIYEIREKNIFKNIKKKFPDLKIIIATNHVSYTRDLIVEIFGLEELDDILISAEINKIKPNRDFYEHILNKMQIKANELLFLDDSKKNIEGAKELGINTIKIEKDTKILKVILNWFDNNS